MLLIFWDVVVSLAFVACDLGHSGEADFDELLNDALDELPERVGVGVGCIPARRIEMEEKVVGGVSEQCEGWICP